jgi:hypothetical protein
VRARVHYRSLQKARVCVYSRLRASHYKQIRMEFHDEKGTRSRARISPARKLQRLRAIDEKAFENTGLLQN